MVFPFTSHKVVRLAPYIKPRMQRKLYGPPAVPLKDCMGPVSQFNLRTRSIHTVSDSYTLDRIRTLFNAVLVWMMGRQKEAGSDASGVRKDFEAFAQAAKEASQKRDKQLEDCQRANQALSGALESLQAQLAGHKEAPQKLMAAFGETQACRAALGHVRSLPCIREGPEVNIPPAHPHKF
jgi:hypothetical protein